MKSNKLLIVMLVALAIIGTVILTNFLSFTNIHGLIIDQLVENQLSDTEYAASRVEGHIIQVKDELVTLSQFPTMETLDVDTCSGDMKIIHEKIEGKIDSLLRVDRRGLVLECSSPKFSSYVGLSIENKDYFRIPKETNEPYISGVVRQGSNKQIIISTPLFETTEYTPYPNFRGNFEGVLLSIIEVQQLFNLYIHPILSPNRFFYIVNIDSGETILKSDTLDDYSYVEVEYPDLSDGSYVTWNLRDYGETIVTSSDLNLGSETWRLIILTPLESVSSELVSVQKRHLFSLGFVMVTIIMVFSFLISLYRSKEDVQLKLDKANVTLEKLGIRIETEGERYTTADIALEPKKVYLVKDDDENNSFELFVGCLNRGFAGLGIVRDDPRSVRNRYNLHKTSFIWLSAEKVRGIPSENDIDNIAGLVSEFIKKSEKSVVLIDRLDYLISENRFETVIKQIHALKDLALRNESIILLSVNPGIIKESQLKAVEAETIDLYGKTLKKKVDLSTMERDILEFVNQKNIASNLVSFKDITDKFRITKPTTRVKIRRLQDLGLLTVERRGRFKAIKITSAGRRILR